MNTIQTSPVGGLSKAQLPRAELSKAGAVPLVFAVGPRDRSFWAGLAAALLVHGVVILGVGQGAVRTIGDPNGSAEAINVDLINESDLLNSMGGAAAPAEAAPSDAPPSAAREPTPPAPATPPAQPSQEPAREAPPELKKSLAEKTPDEPAPVVEPAPAPVPPRAAATKAAPPQPSSPLPIDDKDLADLLSLKPSPAPQKTASADPASPSQPRNPNDAKTPSARPAQKASPKVDLTLPSGASSGNFYSGRAAAVSRPDGITRSGENDEFARGVIRALRQTMPDPRGKLSRLTVRILLNATGNLAEVRLVSSSGYPALDQDVMFAIKQSNFPIPAASLKPIDWIFVVTYLYN